MCVCVSERERERESKKEFVLSTFSGNDDDRNKNLLKGMDI